MSVAHALLALLSEGPKYGLRLQMSSRRTGEVWPLNVGQVHDPPAPRARRVGRDRRREGERSQSGTGSPLRGIASWPDGFGTPPELVPPPARRAGDQGARRPAGRGTDVHEVIQRTAGA